MKNINKDIKLALKIEEDKIRRTISACSSWPGLPRTKSRATRSRLRMQMRLEDSFKKQSKIKVNKSSNAIN